jgi:hypothetical protein
MPFVAGAAGAQLACPALHRLFDHGENPAEVSLVDQPG